MIWPVASKQGQGRKIAHNLDDLCEAVQTGLSVSPSQQCLLEFSTYGFKELDFVVMRDREDNHYLAASIAKALILSESTLVTLINLCQRSPLLTGSFKIFEKQQSTLVAI